LYVNVIELSGKSRGQDIFNAFKSQDKRVELQLSLSITSNH